MIWTSRNQREDSKWDVLRGTRTGTHAHTPRAQVGQRKEKRLEDRVDFSAHDSPYDASLTGGTTGSSHGSPRALSHAQYS